jgi:hypothetical protein
LKGTGHLAKTGIGEKIILKWVVKKYCVKGWAGTTGSVHCTIAEFYEHDSEYSGAM